MYAQKNTVITYDKQMPDYMPLPYEWGVSHSNDAVGVNMMLNECKKYRSIKCKVYM